jgi:hypothetical protein
MVIATTRTALLTPSFSVSEEGGTASSGSCCLSAE